MIPPPRAEDLNMDSGIAGYQREEEVDENNMQYIIVFTYCYLPVVPEPRGL